MRHAESTANVARILPDDSMSPPKLTEKGIMQARRTGQFLKDADIDALYSSPMLRAVDTAKYVAESIKLQYKVDERLKELGLGKLAGINYLQISKEDPKWYEEMFFPYSKYGLEKFSHAMERMLSFIDDIYDEGCKKVVVVSHLEPIRAVIASGINDDGTHVREARLDNASLSIISYDGERIRLKCFNWLPLSDYSDAGT
jgi:broad specificity phosphatase PhoE